ncbi:LysE family transporter [Mycobacterium sp. NPDC048908]|uniref:LysE family transporter n=1 Tax=Mycobacterium sp. NPDC048908 TaxID=3364292 RepID=UPI00371A2858
MVHTVSSDWHLWLGFLGASIAIAFSPGAGAIQSMASGLSHGLLRSYWSIVGQELGLLLQLTLVALGVGAIVAKSILAFTIIKFAGVLYLLYLAVRQWRASASALTDKVTGAPPRAGISLLARGFLVNVTNPKALVFYLAVLPQFVAPTAPLPPQYLVIGLTFITTDIVVMSVYAGLATRLLKALGARRQRLLNRCFSGLFATAAVVLALVRRAATA